MHLQRFKIIIRCVALLNRRMQRVVRSVRKGGVSGRVVADLTYRSGGGAKGGEGGGSVS